MGQNTITLFSGKHERSMDAKKRVAVPSGWLELDKDEPFYVVPHPSKDFLMVMRPAEFVATEQRFEASDLPPERKRKAIRQFYSDAHLVETDGQGRIVVPEEHCTLVNLAGTVVFVGSRSRFEIWNKERHQQAVAADAADYLEAANAIGL